MRHFLTRVGIALLIVGFVIALQLLLMYTAQFDWSIAGLKVSMLDIVGALLAALPALIISQHALDLYFRVGSRLTWHIEHIPHEQKVRLEPLMPAYKTAAYQYQQSRSFRNVSISYGLPAIFCLAATATAYYFVQYPHQISENPGDAVVHGIRLGALGAYTYVIPHLTQRYFQRDISTGGATWCGANLVLGPILGGLLAQIWRGDGTADLTLAQASVYFLAGLAPRYVADRINDVLRRTFLNPGDSNPNSPRSMSLTNIRGITTLIEDRFYEEGIFDVYGLAMANPFRLLFQTPFDKRQIVAWIDEAILITVLPQHWSELQREGFTGAIDLATLALPKVPASSSAPPAVQKLAVQLKADPVLFFALVNRLYEDMQVRLIWGLYQSITAEDEQTSTSSRA